MLGKKSVSKSDQNCLHNNHNSLHSANITILKYKAVS